MKFNKHQEELQRALINLCDLMAQSGPQDMAATFFSFLAFWESRGIVAEELVDSYRKTNNSIKETLDKEACKKLFGHEKGGLS